MERVYALGIYGIEAIQIWFQDYEGYLEVVNHLSNPHYGLQLLFPIISIVDSVFGAQLLLCLAFGGWLNAVVKWWLLEDRPYWWVRETSYYSDLERPWLRQTSVTCETGPGSPSGHTANAASVLILTVMWISHVLTDRKWNLPYWKPLIFPVFAFCLCSVMVARMYVASHFPHQCLMGGLIGSFLAPALCIYVTDPYIWRYGVHATMSVRRAMAWHLVAAITAAAIAVLTFFSLKACGADPQSTIKLAFRWCEDPTTIHVSTTPIFALVQCTSYLVGWSLTVTPEIARFRHYTKNRSIVISSLATALCMYIWPKLEAQASPRGPWAFYPLILALGLLKPLLYLRVIPAVSIWPFAKKTKVD